MQKDQFINELKVNGKPYAYLDLKRLGSAIGADMDRLPYSIRILVENLLRKLDGRVVKEQDVRNIAGWQTTYDSPVEIPYHPARVLMQDFTGVPAVVDLAAMRDAVAAFGGDARKVNPLVPVDLIIDHSVRVDYFGAQNAITLNVQKEYELNGERYALLKWAQKSFDNFQVVPPRSGICHQVNLEHLSRVVVSAEENGRLVAYPDTLVGLDSHTTMINGLGVMGWGVGGIEAEAVMLGQPYYFSIPQVIGVKMSGHLKPGVTATDLVLVITEMLRQYGVVEKFVEFFGPGMKRLTVPDRATISNMSPEYGATMGFFPIDEHTLEYMRLTARDDRAQLAEAYARANNLFYEGHETPEYSHILELDLSTVEPSLAGPSRPQDRIPLKDLKGRFAQILGCAYERDAEVKSISQFHDESGTETSRGAPMPTRVPGNLPARTPRPAGRFTTRQRGHRRHHLLYQHVQSLRPYGSRIGGEKGCRERSEGPLLRQNVTGPRIESGHAIPGRRRPYPLSGSPGISPGRLRLHDLYREQRGAQPGHRKNHPGKRSERGRGTVR